MLPIKKASSNTEPGFTPIHTPGTHNKAIESSSTLVYANLRFEKFSKSWELSYLSLNCIIFVTSLLQMLWAFQRLTEFVLNALTEWRGKNTYCTTCYNQSSLTSAQFHCTGPYPSTTHRWLATTSKPSRFSASATNLPWHASSFKKQPDIPLSLADYTRLTRGLYSLVTKSLLLGHSISNKA